MRRFDHRLSLQQENLAFSGTAGVSEGNRHFGFLPAFLNAATGEVYASRVADGRPAPVHLLEGLPSRFFRDPSRCSGERRLKSWVISGFVRGKRFYTREEVASRLQDVN